MFRDASMKVGWGCCLLMWRYGWLPLISVCLVGALRLSVEEFDRVAKCILSLNIRLISSYGIKERAERSQLSDGSIDIKGKWMCPCRLPPAWRSNGARMIVFRMGDLPILQNSHLILSMGSHDWAIADYPGATLARVQSSPIPCDKFGG